MAAKTHKTHYCTAKIVLGQDPNNINVRGPHEAVSWPEVMVLMAIHGQDAVSDVEPVRIAHTTVREELERLRGIYGGAVERVFPAARPNMEWLVPGHEDFKPPEAPPAPEPAQGEDPDALDVQDEDARPQTFAQALASRTGRKAIAS